MTPYPRRKFALLSVAAAVLLGACAPKAESPFEWKGLRAGMRFSQLAQHSGKGGEWKRTPFIMTLVFFERATAVQNRKLGAGSLKVLADTSDDRVLEVYYGPVWIPDDSTQRVSFEREMEALTVKWDSIAGGARQQTGESPGPYFFSWTTPDSIWEGKIFYYGPGGLGGPGKAHGFEIKERNFRDRLFARIDSMNARSRRP